MIEFVVRFFIGGIVVSGFAMLGDMLRPKSFAGLFGAAPSVALATLGIAIYQHGAGYAAQQTRSMTAGAIALAVYGVVVCQLLMRARLRAAPATLVAIVAWLIVAFGLLSVVAGGRI
jgi:uncharacterized membrane protein (GlpM family)